MRRWISGLSFVVLATVAQHTLAEEPTEGERLFALQIKPLLAEKCLACHGRDPKAIKGALDLRTRAATLKGGESYGNAVLIPGRPRRSLLYRAVIRADDDYAMPPKEADKLSLVQSNWVRDWIEAGAPWPDEKRVAEIQAAYAKGVQVPTSGGLNKDWTERRYESKHLWAYRPLQIENPPAGTHPVDWFIDRQLRQRKLAPAPSASPRELARRLSFGLTGLPPNINSQEYDDFLKQINKESTEAVAAYAHSLRESQQFGEHMGRQWLDVVRYADTAGFANDYARPNAWRYRDYVVRAFNNDKPYNRFVLEQIAGDEIDSKNVEHRIATGFLRMGPWEHTGMSVFRVTRTQWLDDITDSVGQTFLAHALQCAKCHDHKFDPIPTRDYYRMMAVFSTTQFAEVNAPFLATENRSNFKQADQWTNAKIAAYQKQSQDLSRHMQKQRKKETGNAKVGDNGLDPGDEASLARMRKNITRHRWELDKTRPIAYTVYSGHTIVRGSAGRRLLQPKAPWAKGSMEADHILTGGDPYTRGAAVAPGPLSAATQLGNMATSSFPAGRGKRRLALATWIVDPHNPLTARVMVNRVWAWHFGKGLAGNPNNFGSTGKLPTHPALLDYLADWFMKNDWSVKQLSALLVTSKAYRRSSRHPDPKQLTERDASHSSYAAFQTRRLTAEEIRDAMLAVTGELNKQVGGIPCRPDLHPEVAIQPRQIMGGTASVYEPDPTPQQRNRRSIYAEKLRGLRDPFFEVFNQPGPDKSCELRETSTVSPQALSMINSVEMQERAIAFAAQLLKTKRTDDATIRQAFLQALGRPASTAEAHACVKHWHVAMIAESKKSYKLRRTPNSVERTVMAEKTGQPYKFIEIMPAFDNYVSDLQPANVNARTRGLAQVCLVLFNLNEFIYLD